MDEAQKKKPPGGGFSFKPDDRASGHIGLIAAESTLQLSRNPMSAAAAGIFRMGG